MSDNDWGRAEFYKEARKDLPGPLNGVRVLEVTTTWAGPRVGSVLADYGADVVRIETAAAPDVLRLIPPPLPGTQPPDGFLNASCNKNKRSICLDVRCAEGLAVFLRLAAQCDVLIENFKKGVIAAWGCGYEQVRAVNPAIVYVSVTGYGQYGPYSERPGYDPAAQAYSGFMHMNAPDPEAPPMRAPTYLADELAGLHGALATMAALRYRDASGEGQHIDISLLDALIDSCTGLHTQAAAGYPTPRPGNPIPFAAPTGVYSCKDGYVYAGILLDAHWRIMAEMIGRPELADDPEHATMKERVARRAEVDAILGAWCAQRTRAEIVEACREYEIAVAPILTPQEALEDPHVQAREAVQPMTHPNGAALYANAPAAKMSRTPLRNRAYAPLLGQHTAEVLREAGYSAEAIQALRDAKAIG